MMSVTSLRNLLLRSLVIGLALGLILLQLPALFAAPSEVGVGIQPLTGHLWLDLDGNHTQTGADQALAGVKLWVFSDNGDQQFHPNLASVSNPALAQPGADNFVKGVTSDKNGGFAFALIMNVRYWLYVDPATLPASVNRKALPVPVMFTVPQTLDLRFDSINLAPPVEPPILLPLGGPIWLDNDDDGVQTAADTVIPGVTVWVFVDDGDQRYSPNRSTINHPDADLPSGDNFAASAVSDENGAWTVKVPANRLYWIDVDASTLPPSARAARSLLPLLSPVPNRVEMRFGSTLPPSTPVPTEPVVPTSPVLGHVWVDVDHDNLRTSADSAGSGAVFWAFVDDGDNIFQPGLTVNEQGALVGDPFLETIVADADGNFVAVLPTGVRVLLLLDTLSLAPAIDPKYEAVPVIVTAPSEVDLPFPGLPDEAGTPTPTEEAGATEVPGATPEATTDAGTLATPEATAQSTEFAFVPTAEATAFPTAEVTAQPTEEAEAGPFAALKGNVFDDANANRSESDGEGGLGGITVRLYADDGDGEFDHDSDTQIGETVTDDSGSYLFEHLSPGSYWVEVDTSTLPDKFVDTFMLGDHGQQNPMRVTVDVDAPAEAASAPSEATEAPEAESTAEATEAAPPEATEIAPDGEAVVAGPNFAYTKDTDGDGAPDGVEGTGDRDNDGIPNYLDPYDPQGVFYIDQTGNVISGVTSSLYADSNGNNVLDGPDQLADTVQLNPQTSGQPLTLGGIARSDGAYRYDINIGPNDDQIPDDGSVRRFFLVIDTGTLPPNITYPSPDVTNYGTYDASPVEGSGEIVPYSIAPNPPIDDSPRPPAAGTTHGYYTQFDLRDDDDEIVNNHIAFAISGAAEPNYFELTPNNVQTVPPGTTWTYTHTLTNDTSASDTYTINPPEVERSNWDQELRVYDSSHSLLATLVSTDLVGYTSPPVAVNDFLTLELDVTPPDGTLDSVSDLTTITAISGADPTITRTVSDLTTAGLTCIQGQVFNDTNRNGDPNVSDTALFAHVIVYDINTFTGGTVGTVGDFFTDLNGTFELDGLAAGSYRVEVDEAFVSLDFVDTSDYDEATHTVTTSVGDCAFVNFALTFGNPKLSMDVNSDNITPGDEFTYHITLKNTTDAYMTDVTVVDGLPGDLTYEQATLDAGIEIDFDEDNNAITFNIGAIEPGDTRDMTIKVEVDSGTTQDSIRNQARLRYAEGPDVTTSETVDLTGSNVPTSIPSTATPGITIPTSLPIGYPTNLPTTGLETASPAMIAGLAVAVVALLIGLGLVIVALRSRGRQHGTHVSAWVVGLVAVLFLGAGLVSGASVFIAATSQPAQSSALDAPTAVAVQPTLAPTLTPLPTRVPTTEATAETTETIRTGLVDYAPNRRGQANAAEASSNPYVSGMSLADWMAGFKPPGQPATHIVIPVLDLDANLSEAPISGSTWDVSGFTHEIAHLQGTAYPGTVGNAVVAGHVTYVGGAGPFRHLDRLNPGDLILAKGDGVVYRYIVTSTETVDPDDVAVTAPMPGANLTLITCAEWDSAAHKYTQRLVVHAVLRASPTA